MEGRRELDLFAHLHGGRWQRGHRFMGLLAHCLSPLSAMLWVSLQGSVVVGTVSDGVCGLGDPSLPFLFPHSPSPPPHPFRTSFVLGPEVADI